MARTIATSRQRARPPIKTRIPESRKKENDPGEFQVLNTRISNGAGRPIDSMPDCAIQSASHGGATRNCQMP